MSREKKRVSNRLHNCEVRECCIPSARTNHFMNLPFAHNHDITFPRDTVALPDSVIRSETLMVLNKDMKSCRLSLVDDGDNSVVNMGLKAVLRHEEVESGTPAVWVTLRVEHLAYWPLSSRAIEVATQFSGFILIENH